MFQLARIKKTGKVKVIEVVENNEVEGDLNYNRAVKVYSYKMLKAFNYEQVSKTSINRCLEETLQIMSPTLPYEVLENFQVSFVPIEKYLITINKIDEL